ncbi:SGNH/GDSL hydrolase family protein [Curtobacterium sp. RRHDQ10]|uniref:SGNH/GDSL hydrolase family protein n=1 Tax=Curtobacterium phyllosphaerae TaxID=3413379 RepID=UPI003BF2F5ED
MASTRSTALIALIGVLAPIVVVGSVLSLADGDSGTAARAAVASGPSASASTPVPETKVVTIGDSIMSGHGLGSESEAWPTLLGFSGHGPVVNLGCSGAGFIAVGDCGTDYQGLISQAVAAQPTLVIIQSSDNDNGEDAAELDSATMTTVRALRAALPSTEIVGFSTLWDQPGAVPAEVAQSSDDLRSAVAVVGGKYIDVGQPIAGQPALLQSDNEHPTDAGQSVLALAFARDLHRAGVHY